MLESALYAASKGKPVFPCGTDKKPLTKNGFKAATTDVETIKRWIIGFPSTMLAIPTGKASGWTVLDVDVDTAKGIDGSDTLQELESKYGRLPETPEVLTPRGGRHLYFKYVPGIRNSAGKLGEGLDIRGDGGYVIAPPSKTADGRRYEWEASSPKEFAEMPQWMIDLLKGKRSSDKPKTSKSNGGTPKHIEGERNQTLASLAGSMRRRGMSHDAIEAALLTENMGQCAPPLDDDEVKAIVRSIGRYEPETSYMNTVARAGFKSITSAVRDPNDVTHHDIAEQVIREIETKYGIRPIATEGAVYRCIEGIWIETPQHKLEVLIAQLFSGEKTCKRKSDFSQIARHVYDIIEEPDFFAASPIGVAVSSGFITIVDGEISHEPLKPEHRQRYRIEFDPKKEPLPKFTAAMDRWLAGDDHYKQVHLLQEVFGAVLLGILPKKQKVVLCYGPSASGKSSTQKILAELVPKQLHSATSPFSWDREYNIASLAGKKLNMVGELPDDKPIPAADFKRVTGGDVLQGRHPTHRPFEFVCSASHIFNSNHLIYTKDRTDAFFRRWIILHFRGQIPEMERRDEYEKEILEAEAPQILNWALEGARRLLKDGFTVTDSHTTLMRRWRQQSSTILEFLNDPDAVELCDEYIMRSEFHPAYKYWCHETGRKPLGKNKALEELESHAIKEEPGIEFTRDSSGNVIVKGMRFSSRKI